MESTKLHEKSDHPFNIGLTDVRMGIDGDQQIVTRFDCSRSVGGPMESDQGQYKNVRLVIGLIPRLKVRPESGAGL